PRCPRLQSGEQSRATRTGIAVVFIATPENTGDLPGSGAHPSGEVSPRLDHFQRLERLPPDIPVGVLEEGLQRFGRAGSTDLAENDGGPAPGLGVAAAGEFDQGRC